MAIRFVEDPAKTRNTLVDLGGMGAVPKDLVDRAAGANPPQGVFVPKPGAQSAADTKIDWVKYGEWLKAQGINPENTNPADVERTRQKQAEAQRYSPPGGVR